MIPRTARRQVLVEHGYRLGKLGYPVGLDDWGFPSRNGKLKQSSPLVTAIRQSVQEAELLVGLSRDTSRRR